MRAQAASRCQADRAHAAGFLPLPVPTAPTGAESGSEASAAPAQSDDALPEFPFPPLSPSPGVATAPASSNFSLSPPPFTAPPPPPPPADAGSDYDTGAIEDYGGVPCAQPSCACAHGGCPGRLEGGLPRRRLAGWVRALCCPWSMPLQTRLDRLPLVCAGPSPNLFPGLNFSSSPPPNAQVAAQAAARGPHVACTAARAEHVQLLPACQQPCKPALWQRPPSSSAGGAGLPAAAPPRGGVSSQLCGRPAPRRRRAGRAA